MGTSSPGRRTVVVKCAYCGADKAVRADKATKRLQENPDAKFFCGHACEVKNRPKSLTVVVKCGICGKEVTRSRSDIDFATRKASEKGQTYTTVCSRECSNQFQRQRLMRPPTYSTFKCLWCGTEKTLPTSTYKARLRASDGHVYCSQECSKHGSRAVAKERVRVALETGVAKCIRCDKVRPLAEFRTRKSSPEMPFPYTRVCIDCQPERNYSQPARKPVAPRSNVARRREKWLRDDEVLDVSQCDHTPVDGPCERAPDWRMLNRTDGKDYRWSCRICGCSYKGYDEAKECCEPKGTMKHGKFYAFGEEPRPKHAQAEGEGA